LAVELLRFTILFGGVESVHGRLIESLKRSMKCVGLLSGELKWNVSLIIEIFSWGWDA